MQSHRIRDFRVVCLAFSLLGLAFMHLPPAEKCQQDPLLHLLWQGDAREFFNPKRYANQRFLNRRRMLGAYEALKRHLGGRKSARIADVACGTGTLGVLFAEDGYQVSFIDNEPRFLKYVRMKTEAKNIRCHQSDVNSWKAGEKYDALFFGEALEHMEDPEQTLAALRENLKTGGLLCLTTPNGDIPGAQEPKWAEVKGQTERNRKLANNLGNHVCEFGFQELKDLVKQAGFGVLEHRLINSEKVSRRGVARALLPEKTLWKLDDRWSNRKHSDGNYGGRTQLLVAQRFH